MTTKKIFLFSKKYTTMGYGKFKFVLWCETSEFKCTYEFLHEVLASMYKRYQWSYIFYGNEVCPDTGRRHIDGYYEVPTARKLSTEINKFRKATKQKGFGQLCIAKGTAGENCDYSEKEGRYTFTAGEPAAQGVRKDIAEAINAIKTGETTVDQMVLSSPELFHTYGRTLSYAEDVVLRSKYRTEMTEGYWYHGPTSTGKSHVAFDGFDPSTHYVYKLNEQWQDGYTGQETVIINDLRNEIKFNHMLLLVDKWPHSVPRRGREPAPFLAKKVIVTSSMSPLAIYGNQPDDSVDQLLRRFKVIEMTTVRGSSLPLTRQ